jgi:hypothetical protein
VIFGLGAQILEDALLPHALHQRPVLDLAVFDRIVDLVGGADLVGERCVANVKVEIFDASFGCRRLGRASALCLQIVGGDNRRNDYIVCVC